MIRPDSDDQPCAVFEPRAPMVMDCYSDGHYLCQSCKRYVGDGEQQRLLHPPFIRVFTIVPHDGPRGYALVEEN